MLEKLKKEVYDANKALKEKRLVIQTWGNVSGFDPDTSLVVIKPSGVRYDAMNAEDMVVVDLQGNIVEGSLNPSSDTVIHLELYKQFPQLRGICHTHSSYATSFAQSVLSIPLLGTTHADYFEDEISCTSELTDKDVIEYYEKSIVKSIIDSISKTKKTVENNPGILVANHGPFTWGNNPMDAVDNAEILENIAQLSYQTLMLNPHISKINKALSKKHFERKHGVNSYYGQKK